MTWDYEKLDENLKRQHLPINDFDGKVTGHIVFGVKAWMDENPEERKRLGWVKHIHFSTEEIQARWPYNPRSQYLLCSPKNIDAYTIEDDYHVIDKSEEMMLFEEMLQTANGDWYSLEDVEVIGGVRFYG